MADQGKGNLKKHKSFALSIDAIIKAAQSNEELGGNLTTSHIDAKSENIYEKMKEAKISSVTILTDPLT